MQDEKGRDDKSGGSQFKGVVNQHLPEDALASRQCPKMNQWRIVDEDPPFDRRYEPMEERPVQCPFSGLKKHKSQGWIKVVVWVGMGKVE